MKTAPANTVSTERLKFLITLILLLCGLVGKGITENLAMQNSNPLDRPGVSLATLLAEGIHHVTAEQAHALMGQYRAGVWIPHYHTDKTSVMWAPRRLVDGKEVIAGPERAFGRHRLDHPTGKMKYTQAKGAGVHGYVPRCFTVPDKGGILYVPEGEFKTLSLSEAGYCSVGAGGIQSCLVKGGETLAPELAEALAVCQPGALAFVGDADTALIPDFSRAMLRLAQVLRPLPLVLPRLPVNAPGKGVDDCRAALNGQFNGWFDSIVGQAVTVNPDSTAPALAMELLRRELDALKTLTDKSAVTRQNALARFIKLAAGFYRDNPTREGVINLAYMVFGVSIDEFRQQVEQARLELVAKAKADREAKAVAVTVPALPVPGTPPCSNGQAAAMESDKLPSIESAEDLINDASASPPPEIIKGLLHQGSKAVLASGSKARKTWILMDLALCVSSGSPFWGLPTVQGRVLYINFEIQRAFFKSRLVKLCEARGITGHGNFDVWNLRGHAAHLGILMPKIIERVKQRGYSIILVDPIYKGLGGRDENSAGDMGQLCNELEALSVQTGAAVVFAAHFTKGNQAGKNAMDRISGSGVVARDADTIITLTQHDVPGAYTVESTLRNFPEPDPFVVGWAFPLMVRRSDLDPAKLKQANGRKPTYAVADVLTLIQSTPLSTMDWCKAAEKQLGLSKRTFLRLKKEALDEGAITPASNDTWTLASTPAQGATGAKSTI